MAEKLGQYLLQKKIGAGGMADVWLAQGPRGVCVVKVPHRHLCDNAEFVRMFLDEASLLAQLNHPNIAQIFDLGQVNGTYYLAMEYVAGFDLMTISLEHERHGELMAPELCARIVADAAGALHYAHEAKGANGQPLNLIHRDVTPHNILLSRQGVVKIIDFGVAKASSTLHRTQVGFVKGKYPYMSPEQVTGQTIDRRVDVYALGLVLYELLTNVRAIAGNNEIEQIDNARYGRIRPVEQLRPNVPVPIRQILGGCLHFDVAGRYPTALALKEDLEKFLTLQRQALGQEDLLRLFRGVAADVGDVEEPAARATEVEQPASQGAVVLPSNAAAKIDELGYSPTQPSMANLKPLQLATPVSVAAPVSPPAKSKGPVLALAGLSLVIVALALALWEPWAVKDAPDAGAALTTPPVAKVDAGPPEPVDAGAPELAAPDAAVPEPVELRAAVVSVTAPTPLEVTVDGKKYGKTPIELELTPGTHRIAAGAKTWAVDLEPGATIDLKVGAAATKEKGTLKVEASPFCLLAVDGKPQGTVSFKELELPAGPHAIQCTLQDPSLPVPRVKTQKVQLKPAARADVKFNMLTD